jgi:hypothetical protein
MNRVIWKYQIGHHDLVGLPMPSGAEVVHFGMQGDMPTAWALVDPAAPIQNFWFRMIGTGHTLEGSEQYQYIGTTFEPPFVWHLFQLRRE